MFKITDPQKTLEKFEDALLDKLSDIVLIYPDFADNVKKNMLWGIFSKESCYSIDKMRHEDFAHIDYTIVEKAREFLQANAVTDPQFFAPSVEQYLKDKKLTVSMQFEDCEVTVEETQEVKNIRREFQGILCLTFPDADIVFDSMIQGDLFDSTGQNEWLLGYVDIYEDWRHEAMRCQYHYLWQLGGHGRWIQRDYNGTYIAQVNIDIGDAGSVYIEVVENIPMGCVDMH